jgi:hypothetical protein
MGVQISYDIVGAGWAQCTIRVDDACATVTASYLWDALEDLASAVAASLPGHPHATASFTEEPGEYRCIFEPVSEGRVSVRILEFKEMWGGRPDKDGTVIFHAQCRLRTLAGALLSELQRLEPTYGLARDIERSGSNMTSLCCGWPRCRSYLINRQIGYHLASQLRQDPRCSVEKVCYTRFRNDYKDQIHDETARQSRWALGIGLTIFGFSIQTFSKAPTKSGPSCFWPVAKLERHVTVTHAMRRFESCPASQFRGKTRLASSVGRTRLS